MEIDPPVDSELRLCIDSEPGDSELRPDGAEIEPACCPCSETEPACIYGARLAIVDNTGRACTRRRHCNWRPLSGYGEVTTHILCKHHWCLAHLVCVRPGASQQTASCGSVQAYRRRRCIIIIPASTAAASSACVCWRCTRNTGTDAAAA